MPDTTTIQSLPLIQPSQAQKHVTHNEALKLIDVMVQLSVQNRTLTVAPVSPSLGQCHIVAVGATATWAGQATKIAVWTGSLWEFFAPREGWHAWVTDELELAVYHTGVWGAASERPGVFAQVGVNAVPDATNRLSVSAPATLLNNAGSGHQLKINKAASTDTASLMFQTGFSGRVEMGTAGSDDFSVKVSADGASFFQGLVIDRTSGRVRVMNGLGITPFASDPATPVDGDVWYNSTSGKFRVRQGGASQDMVGVVAGTFSDSVFTVQDNGDATKRVQFEVSGVATATTRTLTVPDISGEIAVLPGTQTFSGNKTFSGSLTASGTSVSLGTSAAASTIGLGTGATGAATTKAVTIGTGGVSGSTTTVVIGSGTAGAGGSTTINTPTVSFAATVTSVQMPGANLAAAQVGVGGATADATNRLAVTAPASLFNNAGNGHQVKVNKAAATDTASLLFQTGSSGRAEIGTVGNDDLTVKVSANGSTFNDALRVNATTARVTAVNGLVLNPNAGDIATPGDGSLWYNSTSAKFRAQIGGTSADVLTTANPVILDSTFTLQDDTDITRQARFQLSGITTATTQTYTLPNLTAALATIGNLNQTFTGTTTFSAASVTVGSSTAAATYGVGTGATLGGNTKAITIGTGGVAGSTTTIAIGSATAGALGTTTFNTPTVSFVAGVTAVPMPGATLTANLIGAGGATPDATNRLAVTAPATLFTNAGNGHQVKVNKAAATDTASLLFQTGFSGRAEMGTTGSDDFIIKVSADGTTFFDGVAFDRATGRTKVQNALRVTPAAGDLSGPVDGEVWYNSTSGKFRARQNGTTVDVVGSAGSSVFSDIAFTLQDNLDATKQAQFELSGLTTATTRSLTVPDASGTLVLTSATQTLTGKTIDLASNTLTGTLSAAVQPAHTGDVTSAAGSVALTIAAAAVTNAKMASMATTTLKGNNTGAAAAPVDLTAAQVKTMLAITSGDVSGLGALAMASSVNLTTQATGTMQAAQEPAHSGDVTNTAGSLALTIAAAAVTNAKLATMAATTLKGNNTGATAAPVDLTAAQVKTMLAITSGDVSGLGVLATASSVNLTTQATGTLQAAQHPAHTGDVTNAAGALALTITANVVDNTKLAQVATARFKGRTTAGTGNVEDLTGTQATALLDTVTSAAKGLAPASGGGTVNFLRADGNWAAPPAGGSGVFSDTVFTLQDNVDATKQALFELGGLTTATTRTYTLPDVTTTLVGLAGTQTMTGDKTLNGVVTLGLPLVMTAQASDPGSPADGWVWYNATSQQLKARTGGSVRIIDSQQDIGWLTPVSGEFMMTTMGAGAATGTLAGAAARVDMFPFTARADNALTGLTLNCTTAVASALGKIAVYDSDANGRPNALITETADLDLSTVGTKTATVTLTLRQGRTYWFGVRHSSTATISTWATNATPDINGGSTIATTTRKVLRRTLTYATAAPASWVFASAEINTAAAPAVWLKV